MKTVFIIFACLTFGQLNAQTNIKVNDKAPKISITDWIQNAPLDKDLKGKFIVLEFWATWCGPCIAAVPHLNELQKEFNQKDLYFISMTYEPVAPIKRLLKRIPFKSVVVTDTSNQTQIKYGDGVEGLTTIPFTVLINNEGIIKWIGSPELLTRKLMADFIAGRNLKSVEEIIEQASSKEGLDLEEVDIEKDTKEFSRLIMDKKIEYYYNIKESKSRSIGKSTGGNVYYLKNYNLTNIYKEIFNTKNLLLPTNFIDKRFDLIFKNNLGQEGLAKLEQEMLLNLNLEKKISLKETTYYAVTVKDSTMLEKTFDPNIGFKSDAGDKLLFTNYSIENMLDEISKISKIKFQYAGTDETKYDFIINKETDNEIVKSLEGYGLTVRNTKGNMEFYEWMYKK